MKKKPRMSATPQKKTKAEVKTVAFKSLKNIYCEWRALVDEFDKVSVSTISNFYKEKIEKVFEPGILKRAIFDFEDKEVEKKRKNGCSDGVKIKLANFPSLNKDLPIHAQTNAGVTISSLSLEEIKEWNKTSAWNACKDSPIARFLLAYIWKVNHFAKVRNVLQGFHEAPGTAIDEQHGQGREDEEESEGKADDQNAVVMRQFGRHLRNPSTQPIFDQHTARYLLVFEQIVKKAGMRYKTYCELFTKGVLPDSAAKLRTEAMRREFVTWWDGHIAIEGGDGSNPEKYLWADRIMFSLGKAAGLIAPKLEKANQGRSESSGIHRRTPKAASNAKKRSQTRDRQSRQGGRRV